ncbi:hypothetical protein FF011L_42370 [Roseimaritima multifibrata]|uniref:Uncharacterized protein n=1 Tax=Roseimaritima multifibrata TaxID=1930274 RepID=A0A517MKM9_9BACT|nr:hypothetical protein [Roseimaritima multifibrata]QDS95441.1 hypothetical protein FF011L_42370 [Roseimaritima multifibrata]
MPNPKSITKRFSTVVIRCLFVGWAIVLTSVAGAQGPPNPPANPAGGFQPLVLNLPVANAAVVQPQQRGRLTTADADQRGLVLEGIAGIPVRMSLPIADPAQFWVITPVNQNLVRIQLSDHGKLWSLTATALAGPVVLQISRRDANQLWRVSGQGAAIRLDSVGFPGQSLAGNTRGVVRLEPTSQVNSQFWLASYQRPPAHLHLPVVRLVQHEYRPLPAGRPARIQLFNSHRSEIRIVLTDLMNQRSYPQQSIQPGQSIPVSLERDLGGEIIERYEVSDSTGRIHVDEFITVVPPAILYDISVYEKFLQSIAIDRTGKSPNVIEDVNYQAKSVGIFPLPAGNALRDGMQIDVWQEAVLQANPGGVRGPISLPSQRTPALSPMEKVLQEQQRLQSRQRP